jgi:hypothetical protein
MRIKKNGIIHAALLLILLGGISGRVQAQLLGSLEPVLHFQTESFDIYAPPNMEPEAERLAGFADKTYAMLCEFFGVKASARRIPVLLSDIEYSLNGYTTLYPSNRIVLLLASADPRSQLATMQDELYSVFLHELVHYVTLNERAGGWRALAWLSGDWIAPEVWMMPQALVEGTAVWVESRLGEEGIGSPGRLNDPAALETVRLERARGQSRSLWDVSGLVDFYGAGNLPYLYGGLFADFLSERYGPDMLGRLWRASSDGNIFRGFDGTLTSRGILERETRVPPRQLWQDFLAWVDDGSSSVEGGGGAIWTGGAQELFSGYVGVAGAGEGVLYFVDLERRGLYALPVKAMAEGESAQENGIEKSEGEGEKKNVRPERLFAVDGMLRNIFFNVKSEALELDWIRIDAQNQEIPARYRYDLKNRTLTYEYDLPVAAPGSALQALHDESEQNIFLYDSWQDSETSIRYGLARIGTAVLPARQLPEGRIEVANIPNNAMRWLSPGSRDQSESPDSVRFALSTIPDKGLSRLAVLEEKKGSWQLSIARDAPQGGVHQPIFIDASHIVYRESKENGQAALCLLDISEKRQGAAVSDRFSAPIPIDWILPSEWLALYAPEIQTALPGPSDQGHPQKSRSTLFPALFSTSRIPYANGSLIGLDIIASDLTERLAWVVFAGWDFSTARPAASTELQLGAGAWQFNVSASDQSVLTTPVARKSTLGTTVTWHRTLLPSFRSISANSHAAFAGVQNNYSASGILNVVPDYYAWATGIGLDFSSAYASRKSPYGTLGFSLSGNVEYESASTAGFGGMSLSGSASLKGRFDASLYGAVAPAGGVAFAPAARYLESGGSYVLSAADIPYPVYQEYRSFLNPSPWYVFGEAQYRLFSLETGWHLRLPFMPAFALRRIVGNIGLRGAGLDVSGAPVILSSAFAQADFDFALLAGLAAETHTHFTVEAAWAFQPGKAGGRPTHISVGLQTSLE